MNTTWDFMNPQADRQNLNVESYNFALLQKKKERKHFDGTTKNFENYRKFTTNVEKSDRPLEKSDRHFVKREGLSGGTIEKFKFKQFN